jgi:hypothetical protein
VSHTFDAKLWSQTTMLFLIVSKNGRLSELSSLNKRPFVGTFNYLKMAAITEITLDKCHSLHLYSADALSRKCGKKPLRPGYFSRFRQQDVEMYRQSSLLDVDICSRIVRYMIQAVTSVRKMVSMEVGLVPLARSTVSVGVSVDP